MISLNFSHSHLSMFLPEQKFSVDTTLDKVREIVGNKFGTQPEYVTLKIKNTALELSQSLANSNLQNGDTIHMEDNNTQLFSFFAELNDIDTSNIEKYVISEDAYNNRSDNFRKWKETQIKAGAIQVEDIGDVLKAEKQTIDESGIIVGKRCQVNGNDENRGEVAQVGTDKALGKGYQVGVRLDEPMGSTDGKVKGKSFFKCDRNQGIFLKPNKVVVGDQQPIDVFEDDDEI